MTLDWPSEQNSRSTTAWDGGDDGVPDGATSDLDASPGELLELLGDDYARRILTALSRRPMNARELTDATEMAKVTTYRRLDRLQSVGLVESRLVVDPNGHHHDRYRLACDRVEFTICDGRVDSSVGEEPPTGDEESTEN